MNKKYEGKPIIIGIAGGSGSGKSTYVMRTVAEQLQKDQRKKIILMVPEQATFCYQYELITRYGLSGVLTLEILSFQQLSDTAYCTGIEDNVTDVADTCNVHQDSLKAKTEA